MFLLSLVTIFFIYIILVDLLSRTPLYEGLDNDDDDDGKKKPPDYSGKYQSNSQVSGSSSYAVSKQAGEIAALHDDVNKMKKKLIEHQKKEMEVHKKLNENTTKLNNS